MEINELPALLVQLEKALQAVQRGDIGLPEEQGASIEAGLVFYQAMAEELAGYYKEIATGNISPI